MTVRQYWKRPYQVKAIEFRGAVNSRECLDFVNRNGVVRASVYPGQPNFLILNGALVQREDFIVYDDGEYSIYTVADFYSAFTGSANDLALERGL